MPDLLIRIKKKPDGSAALTGVRRDGSSTWQQQNGQIGRIFPLHDLTHYAVEIVLGCREGFFGLLASGWQISDFAAPWPNGRPPAEARLVELLVGYFDLERMTGERTSAAEINQRIEAAVADGTLPRVAFRIDDAQVAEIHDKRAELFARWNALAAGDALELQFERRPEPADTNAVAEA
jgi:hypothetical protein